VCICILTGLRFLLLFLVFHEKLLIKSYKNHQNSNFWRHFSTFLTASFWEKHQNGCRFLVSSGSRISTTTYPFGLRTWVVFLILTHEKITKGRLVPVLTLIWRFLRSFFSLFAYCFSRETLFTAASDLNWGWPDHFGSFNISWRSNSNKKQRRGTSIWSDFIHSLRCHWKTVPFWGFRAGIFLFRTLYLGETK